MSGLLVDSKTDMLQVPSFAVFIDCRPIGYNKFEMMNPAMLDACFFCNHQKVFDTTGLFSATKAVQGHS